MSKELRSLLDNRTFGLSDWLVGKIPEHYKRLSVSREKALELAKLGASKIWAYFGIKLYFSQAVIAGAILSREYDEFVITTCSQYGKSFLMGRLALLNAFMGRPTYIAATSGAGASIIMGNVIDAVSDATPEIQNELLNRKDQLDRLATSVSKTRIAFASGGFVEAITLADTYQDNIARNQAVGRAGDFFLDEAALVSDDTFAEMGRREFARVDGTKYAMVMISNPHNPGAFYDKLTEEDLPGKRFVLWMDALTAVEEERWSEDLILDSDFDRNKHQRRKYLLCELDSDEDSMFTEPKLYEYPYGGDFAQYFLGVDSAYRGKDNITVAINAVDENGACHIDEVVDIDKGEWIDGVTSEQIIDDVTRIARRFRCSFICVDIGFGVWLVEGLAKRGLPVLGINFGSQPTPKRKKAGHYSATNAQNVRAEMHLDMQNLLDEGKLLMTEQSYGKVKDAFPFVRAERKANGRIQVRPKSEIKAKIGHSPDELDAVLLSIHAPIVFGGEFAS